MKNRKMFVGFTLAEVLITLSIIGVVAALTIPTLMQNSSEKANVVALKKAYSILSSAYKLAEQENGTPDNWGMVSGNTSTWKPILGNLLPYLKIDKDCIDGSSGCFPAGVAYKYLASSKGEYGVLDTSAWPKAKLVDGTLLASYVWSSSCGKNYGTSPALKNVCGEYWVDINGYKKPNQWGKDTFQFYLTKYGVIPAGTAQETNWTFTGDCKDKDNSYGIGCAAWLIYQDNMDYLHCNDLDWNTKAKCD